MKKICQELLFARNLETDTKGETIFKTLEKFCDERGIPLKNIISAATDGASAMTGYQKGFTAHLKRQNLRYDCCTLRYTSTTFGCWKFK